MTGCFEVPPADRELDNLVGLRHDLLKDHDRHGGKSFNRNLEETDTTASNFYELLLAWKLVGRFSDTPALTSRCKNWVLENIL